VAVSRVKKSGTTPGRYRDAFVEHLAGVLRGEFPNVRQRLFIDWLERLPFYCERCGEEFEVSASDVSEDDVILCAKYQKARR
jgi:hypothetical protein